MLEHRRDSSGVTGSADESGLSEGSSLLHLERRISDPTADVLDEDTRRLARVQAREDDAVAVIVDEREGERLPATGVLKGVEPNQADVRDGGTGPADGIGDRSRLGGLPVALRIHVSLEDLQTLSELLYASLKIGRACGIR